MCSRSATASQIRAPAMPKSEHSEQLLQCKNPLILLLFPSRGALPSSFPGQHATVVQRRRTSSLLLGLRPGDKERHAPPRRAGRARPRRQLPCSTGRRHRGGAPRGENERRAGGIIDGARTWGRTGARPVDGEACPCPTGCRQMPRTPCMATPWRGCRRSSTTRKQEGKAKCNSNCISDRGAYRTAPDRSLFLSGSVHGPSCMLTWFVLYVHYSRLPPPGSNCFVPRSFRRFSLWARAASFRASLPRSPVRNVPRHVLARRRRLFFLAIVAGGELSNAQTQARLLPFFAMTNPTRPQSDTIGGFPALRPSEVPGGEVPQHSAGAYPGVFSSRGGDETA